MKSLICFLLLAIIAILAQNTTTTPEPIIQGTIGACICPSTNGTVTTGTFLGVILPLGILGAITPFLVLAIKVYETYKATGKIDLSPEDVANAVVSMLQNLPKESAINTTENLHKILKLVKKKNLQMQKNNV